MTSPRRPPPAGIPRRKLAHACPWLLTVLLAGCATYAPLPLGHPHGARHLVNLTVNADTMPIPALARHRFDPRDGLDVTEVAMLAVANDPQLKVQRDALGVARAQAFAAGLLPDPQISLSADFPHPRGAGLVTGYSLGLSEDLAAILTRPAHEGAARAKQQQIHLQLLWAEWQTIAKARLLFNRIRMLQGLHARLKDEKSALEPIAQHLRTALKTAELTYAEASTGLGAMAKLQQQLATNAVQRNKAENDLRTLLGLAPGTALKLTGPAWHGQVPDASAIRKALATLPERRPDLLALQAGYRSQQARVRAAIVAQYPAITLGFHKARDTGSVTSLGPDLNITLPLFNRNRGQIAVARATRQKLKDAYRARMLATRGDVHRLRQDLVALEQQRDTLAAHARRLDHARKAANRAWKNRALAWPTYLAIRAQALQADMALASARQDYYRQLIALETLLGNSRFSKTSARS